MNQRRRTLAAVTAALITALVAASPAADVFAQVPYPARPIRFVVAFAPGGPADIIARLLGQRLSELLGQAVVVENRAGAGGNIAAAAAARALPDGYTLLLTTSAFAANPSLSKNPGYDPEKDDITIRNTRCHARVMPQACDGRAGSAESRIPTARMMARRVFNVGLPLGDRAR